MKDSFLYPIIFMLITVLIFTGILAVMYRLSQGKIQAHIDDSYNRKVLITLAGVISEKTGIAEDEIIAAYPDSYDNYIVPIEEEGFERNVFAAEVNGEILGYAFEIAGNGLWGSMSALVSLNTQLDTILELRLVSQMETPGLGARIEEDWFLSQFKDRLFVYNPMSESDVSKKYEFIAETQTPKDDSELRGVTGATITSGAVLQMLKDEITYIYNAFEREEQL